MQTKDYLTVNIVPSLIANKVYRATTAAAAEWQQGANDESPLHIHLANVAYRTTIQEITALHYQQKGDQENGSTNAT